MDAAKGTSLEAYAAMAAAAEASGGGGEGYGDPEEEGSPSKFDEPEDLDEEKAAEFEADEGDGKYEPFKSVVGGSEGMRAILEAAEKEATGVVGTEAEASAFSPTVPKSKSNTTSSLFVSSTLSNPDVEEMLYCVSLLLQHQMAEENATPPDPDVPPPAYDFSEDETAAAVSGPEDLPSLDEIYTFLRKTFRAAKWSPECHIMALVYVNRLTGYTSIRLHNSNWRPILLCSLLLAQKLWDDKSLANVDFPYIWNKAIPNPSHSKISLARVNYMERKFLEQLRYNVNVKASLYAKYYFELRTLRDGESFPLQPLKPYQARRLEARSAAADSMLSGHEREALSAGSSTMPPTATTAALLREASGAHTV